MNFAKLDAFMNGMPDRGFPGCELAVTVDGKTVYHRCVGYSDVEKTRPANENDLYWIFSCTKVITCLAAMRLLEEGKLSLTDPVSKYLPAYENMQVIEKDKTVRPAKTVMTVEHLFTMTGGMTYDVKVDKIAQMAAINANTVQVCSFMANDPLIFDPGTHYKYSLCHDVLAAVVEVASGVRFSDYVNEIFFKPLGLTNIGFHPNEEQKDRFTAMYRCATGTRKITPIPNDNSYAITPDYDSGGAGLFSNVTDYLKVISVIACGGTAPDGTHFLKPETIRMMQENRLCDDALNDFVTTRLFGYGWGLCGRVHMEPSHSLSLSPKGEFGWDGAAAAFSMIDPENRVALYFGTHVRGYQYAYHVVHPTIRNLVYEALSE